MAQNNDTTVGLYINGKQAEQTLAALREKAESLGKQLEEAVRNGDTALQKKLKKSIKDVNQTINQMQASTRNVADVMARLDRATPHELRKTLDTLNRQLKSIERGTPAWDAHVAKIRSVKAEVDKVNAELRQSESLLVRVKNKVNDWGAMAMGAVGAMTGVVMAGKKAVNTYAEMQQEEANVRKYTGMTAEEVDHLNEAFKKMDTRTSREQLNKLAQEAGRLGLQSEEDVLGFVKAADKINVALDDLGEGATLTLSKLTDIFGDKQRLGVEQSLLSVGSVINELSQNSTASAPYLAEFAQRLAGVGAQAHMTIPEIMGFGAVLDSQGQKLEMSSTALSKVIMNMFKDPAKIAEATGLSIEQFSETCKRSTNEGLLMLLERLNELGGIDSLAPVFKDMGENGARASAVLAALAGNVDMVRQQQEAANVAFNEAISIDKEFEVQNTTVQAGLEKARKGFTEMAVTLGKELMPIVSKIISGTSMTMRVMLKVIQFVKQNRTEILALTAAVVTYYTVMKAQDAWNAFVGGCKKAIEATKAFTKALMSNPYAAAAALIVGMTIAITGWIRKSREAARAADEQRKALERQREAEKATASAVGEVVGKYQLLKAEWENLSSAQEKKEWLDKNRDAFEQLGLNINNAVEADEAFVKSSDKVIAALQARAKANALKGLYEQKMQQVYEDAAAIEDNMGRRKAGDYRGTQTAEWKAFAAAGLKSEGAMFTEETEVNPFTGDLQTYTVFTEEGARIFNEYMDQLHQQAVEDAVRIGEEGVKSVFGSWMTAAQEEAAKAESATNGLVGGKKNSAGNPPSGGGGNGGGPSDDDNKTKLNALEDRKKRELAIEDAAYALGEKSFSEYNERKREIELKYHQDRLKLLTKGSTEYLQEEAAVAKAEKAIQDADKADSKKSLEESYADQKRMLDQQYMDGKMNHEVYTRALEELELRHLKEVVSLYKEGSDDYITAQEEFQKKEHEIQKKRFDERKKIEDQIKKSFFTDKFKTSDPEEYYKQSAALEVVHSQLLEQAKTNEERLKIDKAYYEAKYLLAKEYNQKEVMENIDAFRAMGDEIQSFLNSELGQNLTKGFSGMVSQMSNLFSQLTSYIEADVKVQTNAITKEYDARIDAAGKESVEGIRLEEEKKAEIAKINTEAANKKFNMQVIETVATGIQSAVNAWNAGWQTGVAGVALAPIFMAMSLAATGVQIAALKKQRDAAASTGYASGGYTRPGRKYEPAGIVHAGEWVASQELLANPTAAATIAQLDQAQKTNTIGQLGRVQDIPVGSVNRSSSGGSSSAGAPNASGSAAIEETLGKLNRRLNEPFVTVNTVTGDKGSLRAQKRYEQLMKNKS